MSYFRQYRPTRHNQLPPGVLNLIIINVIMYVVTELAWRHREIDMRILLGLHHPFSDDFRWYQYVTSMFMHADPMHIGYNMLGLWLFGHILENHFGTRRFMIFYLVCGLGASLIYQVWGSFAQLNLLHKIGMEGSAVSLLSANPPLGYLIGASGAVFGLIMGAALLSPNTQLYYMGFLGIPMKIKWIATIYGLLEVWRGYQMSAGDNVAHFAHIGGMIFGFILVKIYARSRTNFY